MGVTIRRLIAEQRGDAWVVDGRVLLEVHSELPDAEIAALVLQLRDVDDAVVSLRRSDGSTTSHRIGRRPAGL